MIGQIKKMKVNTFLSLIQNVLYELGQRNAH